MMDYRTSQIGVNVVISVSSRAQAAYGRALYRAIRLRGALGRADRAARASLF
jgi:hypothetical protein